MKIIHRFLFSLIDIIDFLMLHIFIGFHLIFITIFFLIKFFFQKIQISIRRFLDIIKIFF